MSERNEKEQIPFDPFEKEPKQTPTSCSSSENGYGSFGRQDTSNGQTQNSEESRSGNENGNGSGSFYGPDYFSGGSGNPGGQNNGWEGGQTPLPKRSVKGYGIASMVCGILSMLCCCIRAVPLILAIAAIALAVVETVREKKMSGFAIAGIVTGAIGLILGVTSLVMDATGAMDGFWSEFQKAYQEALNGESSSGTSGSSGTRTTNPNNTMARIFTFSGTWL
jgi:hypothetical protein